MGRLSVVFCGLFPLAVMSACGDGSPPVSPTGDPVSKPAESGSGVEAEIQAAPVDPEIEAEAGRAEPSPVLGSGPPAEGSTGAATLSSPREVPDNSQQDPDLEVRLQEEDPAPGADEPVSSEPSP